MITEFTPMFYSIFFGLTIISAGIICAVIFKKIQDYKNHEEGRKNVIGSRIDKVENGFQQILKRLVDIDQFLHSKDIEKVSLEVMAIRGIAKHQLGHMLYFRSLLK